MKRIGFLLALLWIAPSVWALDPYAPRSERGQGRIVVYTTQPENDQVTITNHASGQSWNTKSGITLSVPIGRYKIAVKMQNYEYTHDVVVTSTETTFFEVPGYGNLKVNSVNPADTVSVVNSKTGSVVATFPVSETKTLPRGHYDVRVEVPGMLDATVKNVWVVTNTTRVIDVTRKEIR